MREVYYFISRKKSDGVFMDYDNPIDNNSFGIYVYLTAMVTSLFDSKEIYEDLTHYYS